MQRWDEMRDELHQLVGPAVVCMPLPSAALGRGMPIMAAESVQPCEMSVSKRRWVRARLRDPLSLHSHVCPSPSEHSPSALLEPLEVPRAWDDKILGTNGEKPQHTAALMPISNVHCDSRATIHPCSLKFSACEQPHRRLFGPAPSRPPRRLDERCTGMSSTKPTFTGSISMSTSTRVLHALMHEHTHSTKPECSIMCRPGEQHSKPQPTFSRLTVRFINSSTSTWRARAK
jgi:hypothetical protein